MGLDKGMCLDSSVTTDAKLIMLPSMLQMNAAGEKWTYQLEAHRGHGSRRSVSSAFGSSSHRCAADDQPSACENRTMRSDKTWTQDV